MPNATFEVYAQKDGKYTWHLKSSNGQITATAGQHFATHADAKRAAEHVKEHAATADVVNAE
jgi:uncharacterized protein YegP (UPF0339 family)